MSQATTMEDAEITDLVVRPGDAPAIEPRAGFWRGVARRMRALIERTGNGAVWLVRGGVKHRHFIPAVLNGAVGDKLAEVDDALAIRMSFRHEGRDVFVDELGEQLDAAEQTAADVVVFVHGLMADEVLWSEPFGGEVGLGPRLALERGLVPLYLRYNSGLHISENGRGLAALLEDLVTIHGDRIRSLHLVGHSMGGLVIRSATHYGPRASDTWVRRLRSVVLLGAPNDGSYIEQLGHLATSVLRAIPNLHTKITARVMDGRSSGIKDLRDGVLVDEDWEADSGSLRRGARTRVPPLPGVHYHVLVGNMTDKAEGPLAAWFGDGIVGGVSQRGVDAAPRSEHVRLKVFPGVGHLGLILAPQVGDYLVQQVLGIESALSRPGTRAEAMGPV